MEEVASAIMAAGANNARSARGEGSVNMDDANAVGARNVEDVASVIMAADAANARSVEEVNFVRMGDNAIIVSRVVGAAYATMDVGVIGARSAEGSRCV